MSTLPGILADVERATSSETALQLLSACGGQVITLSAAENSTLVKAVGVEAAAAIVKEVGGGRVAIPMAHARGQRARRIQAARLLAQGATANEVAAAADMHERTARRVRARMKKSQADQGDLFD